MKLLTNFMKWINRLNAQIGGALVFLIALILLAGFVSRITGKPLYFTVEFTSFAMIAIVFLGFAICEENDGHVQVEVLTNRLNKQWQKITRIFALIIAIVISTYLVWSSLIEAMHSFAENEMTIGLVLIPVYPAKFIITIGLSFYFLQLFIKLVEVFRQPYLEEKES